MEKQVGIMEKPAIDSVLKIISEIFKVVEEAGDKKYIYRGESRCFPKVCSGIYRIHVPEEIKEPEDIKALIERAQEAILNGAKNYLPEIDGDDMKILAELQHYGAKTNLIDFTTDYLIALFFASDGHGKENGRVIFLLEDSPEREKYEVIEVPRTIQRANDQKSRLVNSAIGVIEPDHIVSIPADFKAHILTFLRTHHDISTARIYNDIHGFIRSQDPVLSHNQKFIKGRISEEKGRCLPITEDSTENGSILYREAIAHYTEALDLKSDFLDAYRNRGRTYHSLNEYTEAIQDYSEAIALSPKYAELYRDRGLVYFAKGDLDSAFENYNKGIELDPEYQMFYYERIRVCLWLRYWNQAETDIEKFKNWPQSDETLQADGKQMLLRSILNELKGSDSSIYNDIPETIKRAMQQ